MTAVLSLRGKIDFRLIILAVALVGAQVLLATLSGRGDSWTDRYRSLWTWDGAWYAGIMESGYSDAPVNVYGQSNLAFFPGYPIFSRVFFRLFSLSPATALLLTTQLSALVFWGMFLYRLREWQVNVSVSLAATILVFCHPAAFFMVVTYSESLFFASLMVLLFCGPRARTSVVALIGAIVAGYIASATRIVGAPLGVVPLVWAWRDFRSAPQAWTLRRFIPASWRYGLISLATAAGTLSFFAFCALKFGHWDMYLRAKGAWGVGNFAMTDLLRPQIYKMRMPRFSADYLLAQDVSHVYVPVLLLLLIAIPLLDWFLSRRAVLTGAGDRAAFYVAAWIFFLALAGGSGLTHASFFLRYGLYCHILLILALSHAYSKSRSRLRELDPSLQMAIFLISAVGLALQLIFCSRYAHAVMVG